MRKAWRGLAGLLAVGAFAVGGGVALADGGHGGGGDHGNKGAKQAAAPVSTAFTMTTAAGNPEGIAFDKRTGLVFVSRVGDGSIWAGTGGGPLAEYIPAGQTGTTAGANDPKATGLKVRKGLLYVAGAANGTITVFDIAKKTLVAQFTTTGTFINDLDIDEDGDIFATDSTLPNATLFFVDHSLVKQGATGAATPIDVSSVIKNQAGFNLNGIVVNHDGDELIVVQSNTGKLFRITLAGNGGGHHGDDDKPAAPAAPATPTTVRKIEEITVAGGPLFNGDGLLVDRGRLLVVQGSTVDSSTGTPPNHGDVAVVKLRHHRTRGTVESRVTDDANLSGPSTIARAKGVLLVVNADFNNLRADKTVFSVASIQRNAVKHGGHGGGHGGRG